MRLPVLLIALCSAFIPALAAAQASADAPNRQAARQPTPAGSVRADRSLEAHGIAAADLARYPEVKAALQRDDLTGALLALGKVEHEHENDPAYYDMVGLLSLKVSNFAGAASAFERVVLMEPDNAGAWLDLAVASMEAGNYTAAVTYFDHIEASFSPPPSLQTLIARFRARITAPAPRPQLGWRLQAEALVGVDTNANSGLSVSSIPLTSGGDRTDLPLDPAYQARRDTYGQIGLATSYKKQVGDSMLEIVANARQRSFRRERDFSTLDLNTGLGLLMPTRLGDVSAWLYASDLSLGGERLLSIGRALVQVERPLNRCRMAFGLESEWRRYATLTNLSANLLWGMGSLGCDVAVAHVPLQLTLLARVGKDVPTGTRAGGRTRNSELLGQLSAPFLFGVYADLSYSVSHAEDEEGYSALLENNAPRRVTRQRTRLQFTYPVRAGLDAVLITDDNKVTSNLALFQQRGRSLSLGFRKQF